jgi:hypothetical protein
MEKYFYLLPYKGKQAEAEQRAKEWISGCQVRSSDHIF